MATKTKKVKIERDPFAVVIAMTERDARRFFGAEDDVRVEDGGPVSDSTHRSYYKPGAHVWHVYLPTEKAKYEPRELKTKQKKFRVDLHVCMGGAYGYGETLKEADDNAWHFLERDWGRDEPVVKRIVQEYKTDHWEVVS